MNEQLPEFYSDVFFLSCTPWGVSLTFGLTPHKPESKGRDVCIVRISHETGKSLAILLRTQLKQYEEDSNLKIGLTPDVMNKLGLKDNEW